MHIFKATRSIGALQQKEHRKALMSILVKHLVNRRMNDGQFWMQVVRLHTGTSMSNLQKFRLFVTSFAFAIHPIHHELHEAHTGPHLAYTCTAFQLSGGRPYARS